MDGSHWPIPGPDGWTLWLQHYNRKDDGGAWVFVMFTQYMATHRINRPDSY
jgi:hypothetical protein